ncbi:MAG: dimethylarginine dimethylaminohydrolase family protein [Maribacter sp.]
MPHTHHSEYLQMVSLYIKTVTNAFIDEDKLQEEWETLNYLSKPELTLAKIEYGAFEALLKNEGIDVSYFPRDAQLSLDSVYCRDASIATDFGMIICSMGKADRRGEPAAQRKTFMAHDIPVLGVIESPGTIEGGDVAWLNETTLAVGHTYRTNIEGIRQLKHLLAPNGVQVIVADLPHYRGETDVFHLMSILSPVDKDLAVVYSPLMPIRFRTYLRDLGFELIEVPDDEFDSMGCNVLAVGPRKCIMVEGNPKTRKALEKAGCEVLTYSGQEISVKGGGGPTCLTRPLKRRR